MLPMSAPITSTNAVAVMAPFQFSFAGSIRLVIWVAKSRVAAESLLLDTVVAGGVPPPVPVTGAGAGAGAADAGAADAGAADAGAADAGAADAGAAGVENKLLNHVGTPPRLFSPPPAPLPPCVLLTTLLQMSAFCSVAVSERRVPVGMAVRAAASI
jgi:hypothetical protein